MAAKELSLVGSFPKPISWTQTTEKALAAANTWYPHTLDFKEVAGRGSIEVTTVWDFLLKIVHPPGALISRLNFFSHGNADLIAMNGEILVDGSNVMLGAGADDGWGEVISRPGAIVDPYATTWGTFGENGGTKNVTVKVTKFTLTDVRARFTPDAIIWLYICHAASNPALFQEIANTFQVTVKGFAGEILYCVPSDFPSNRKHKLAVMTTPKPPNPCETAVADFHGLDSDSRLRTALPKKP